MTFIKDIWYVAAWSHELDADAPIGRTIIDEPIVLYRKTDGSVVAMEDRCPHRHAPLSLGRIMGDDIQCMYHGLTLGCDGLCKSIPGIGGIGTIPPHTQARVFPVAERASWIWIWMGDPAKCDLAHIPAATGLDDPDFTMEASALDYDAHYELINDNLTDLSHLDFTHETSLGAASGLCWSMDQAKITPIDNGLLIARWFVDAHRLPGAATEADVWSCYRYILPGLFLMEVKMFARGAAAASHFGEPAVTLTPVFERREQQAVTPISASKTRYLYATGTPSNFGTPAMLAGMFAVVNTAFAEDKAMIEAQQRIWDRTPVDRRKAFLPQDKAPAMFRRLIASRLKAEAQ